MAVARDPAIDQLRRGHSMSSGVSLGVKFPRDHGETRLRNSVSMQGDLAQESLTQGDIGK